jgi:tRNA threonylcarbamoyladenosine biosynthesis protein TsaE
MSILHFISGSDEDTRAIGRRLGELAVSAGSGSFCLYGELGAGKTTFIKGFASAFGIAERDIGSASFVIVAEYESVPPLYHIDLYRIQGQEALDHVGIWDYLDAAGVAVIEWSERLGQRPDSAVGVTIEYAGEHSRKIIVEGASEADWNYMQGRKA